MVCVYCGKETRVINSRPQRKNNQVWRRRRCLACNAIFSTLESVQYELAWIVDSQGRSRPFSRDKLLLSLYRSCEHRKSALSDVQGLTKTVISKLRPYIKNGQLSSREIAQVAQVALNRFDNAASVRYRAFHKG